MRADRLPASASAWAANGSSKWGQSVGRSGWTQETGIDEATALANEVTAQSSCPVVEPRCRQHGRHAVGRNPGRTIRRTRLVTPENIIKQKLDAQEAFTNDLIDDINKFDAREVTAMA